MTLCCAGVYVGVEILCCVAAGGLHCGEEIVLLSCVSCSMLNLLQLPNYCVVIEIVLLGNLFFLC